MLIRPTFGRNTKSTIPVGVATNPAQMRTSFQKDPKILSITTYPDIQAIHIARQQMVP